MTFTELDFGDARDDFEALWVYDDGLDAWLESRGVPPVHLSVWSGPALEGYPTKTRIGGVFVQPASTVLGIRAWDDALEGVFTTDGGETVPWVLFDLEKIVRMMLRQSGTAFEILASPICARHPGRTDLEFSAHRIVEAAIHKDILFYYRDFADGVRWDVDGLESREYRLQIVDAVRHALTGLRLIDGVVEFELASLLDEVESDVSDAVRAMLADDTVSEHQHSLLRNRLASWCQTLAEPGQHVLGDQPHGYDWLDDLVVQLRLESTDA